MKHFEVILPDTLDDLTLGQWQEVKVLQANKELTDEFVARRLLKIVYGIPMNQMEHIGVRDIELMLSKYNAIINSEQRLSQRFTMDATEYGLIPNFDDISFGEWCDLNEYKEEADYHKLMSILFRKVTKKRGRRYAIASYTGSHERFKAMPLGVALGAIGFFLQISSQLVGDTLSSLTAEEQALIKKRLSERNGDGTRVFTPSPAAIY